MNNDEWMQIWDFCVLVFNLQINWLSGKHPKSLRLNIKANHRSETKLRLESQFLTRPTKCLMIELQTKNETTAQFSKLLQHASRNDFISYFLSTPISPITEKSWTFNCGVETFQPGHSEKAKETIQAIEERVKIGSSSSWSEKGFHSKKSDERSS